MSFKLNPVKAVCNMKKWYPRDIIGMNDSCFGICAAFSSGDDAYRIQPECAKACDDFIEERRHEVYGVTKCDHQAPYRPVIWDNIQRFVPMLMKKGKTPEEALALGKQMCKDVPNLYNECVELCNLDFSAVEQFEHPGSKSMERNSEKKGNNHHTFLIVLLVLLLVAVSIWKYNQVASA
jgi:hypothetical protein